MPDGRPAIPKELKRSVLLEAGHRCAIPTCHATTMEIAHIVPWSEVKEHTFDNLIALCPNCHTRYDQGEIDRKSMLQYKANLTILHSRYGDLERRIIENFATNPHAEAINLDQSMEILILHLLQDGLLFRGPSYDEMSVMTATGMFVSGPRRYILTNKGRDFVDRWVKAKEIQ